MIVYFIGLRRQTKCDKPKKDKNKKVKSKA